MNQAGELSNFLKRFEEEIMPELNQISAVSFVIFERAKDDFVSQKVDSHHPQLTICVEVDHTVALAYESDYDSDEDPTVATFGMSDSLLDRIEDDIKKVFKDQPLSFHLERLDDFNRAIYNRDFDLTVSLLG